MSLTSESREVALAIIPKITGVLSMAGSGWIAYQVLSNGRKRRKTYHRLVTMMSLCDIVSSFSYFLSTWPIPPGVNLAWSSPHHYQAVGNAATCSAQGFGIQFGVTAAFFNLMLAIHYLLVIKFNHSEDSIQKKEPYMWGIALTIGLGLAVLGLILNVYHNSNLWCWIAPNWDLCQEQGLPREQCDEWFWGYRWALFYAPIWACIVLITLAHLHLWWTVRRQELRVSRYRPTDTRANRMRQSRAVLVQATWYVVAFAVTWVPYTSMDMTGRYFSPHDNTGFVVLLFVVICQPIQGFLNVCIYHRHSIASASSDTVSSLVNASSRGFRRLRSDRQEQIEVEAVGVSLVEVGLQPVTKLGSQSDVKEEQTKDTTDMEELRKENVDDEPGYEDDPQPLEAMNNLHHIYD